MTGGYVPYRLRQNKAVDRFAFLELLSLIGRHPSCDVSDYFYVGFGGPSLEDYKALHYQFNITKMLSLEINENVYKRQKFNLPLNCIECQHGTSKEYLDTFARAEPTIFWLDYTSPKELKSQMGEFQTVVLQIEEFDICKITLNANVSTLGELKPKMSQKELREARLTKLKYRLGDLFPGTITEQLMDGPRYPQALLQVLRYAAETSMQGQVDFVFQPLSSYVYADGQQMMTFTGIKLKTGEEASFLSTTKLDRWILSNTSWANPKKINVPDLTFRERFEIDSQLPGTTAEDITNKLKFTFVDSLEESINMLKIYTEFYRHAPFFSEVVL